MFSYHDQLIIAHAVFACIGVLLLAPTGILLASFLRSTPSWFKLHAGAQGSFLVFMVITFALGIRAVDGVELKDTTDNATLHHRLGFACFFLVVLQVTIGILAHYTQGAPKRHWSRYIHIVTGVGLAALGYATVYDGFYEWGVASDAGTLTPRGVRIVFWVLLALAMAAYTFGSYRRWTSRHHHKSNPTDSSSTLAVETMELPDHYNKHQGIKAVGV